MRPRLLLTLFAVLGLLGAAAIAQGAQATRFSGAVIGPQVRPATVWLSADGTLVVQHTRWRRWGGATAVGTGIAEYHGCRPFCGAAPIHHAAVTVVLSDPVVCRAAAHVAAGRYYDTVRLILRGGRQLDGPYLRVDHWAPCRQFSG